MKKIGHVTNRLKIGWKSENIRQQSEINQIQQSDLCPTCLKLQNSESYGHGTNGVSAGKRDQIDFFLKKKFLSKIDVNLVIWSRSLVISKKNFLSIWSLFPALIPNVLWLFLLILGLGNVWSVCTRLERLGWSELTEKTWK